MDRLRDDGTPCGQTKGRDIDAWLLHLYMFTEFEQPLYTHKYEGGCSKLDRILTNLAPIEFSNMGTACNLLGVHNLVSDHFPNSARFFKRAKIEGTVKPWIAKSAGFKMHVEDRLECLGLGPKSEKVSIHQKICRDPQQFAFELQRIFRESAYAVKMESVSLAPKTTQHKIALCSSLQRAIAEDNKSAFEHIVSFLPQFVSIPLGNNYKTHPKYLELIGYFNEQLHQLALEKAREKHREEDEEEKFLEFGGLGSSYAVIYGLKPGGFSTISALQVPNIVGPEQEQTTPSPPSFTTNANEMAEILNDHWGRAFSKKDIDLGEVEYFAREIKDFAKADLLDLLPNEEDADNVLKRARDSGVGPDGLPYSVYKACPVVSIALILALIDSLMLQNTCLDMAFLLAFLVFLPKKSFAQTPSGLSIYKAENTRPLSLSNTLIKLTLTCMKLKLCQFIDSRIHRYQKCITGRNLLENVVKLDAMMHICATNATDSAAILFDFVSAFPSVDHTFLWAILEAAGLPIIWINAIKKCYHNNKHVIRLEGKLFDGPTIFAGVRQGCPLSMILFAIVVEPLLRLLEKIAESGDEIGCFADDIGLVFRNIRAKLAKLAELFKRFKKASGLDLNTGKCVAIPLENSPDACTNLAGIISEIVPEWRNFKVALNAEYLGFQIGPNSTNLQWNKVIAKASDTVLRWQALHLGFFFNLLACNVFILSLFSYIGQLSAPSKQVFDFIEWMKRRLFMGPGNWLPTPFLENMETFGLPTQLRNLREAMSASKVRVFCSNPDEYGQLSVRTLTATNGFADIHGSENPHSAWHRSVLLHSIAAEHENIMSVLDHRHPLREHAKLHTSKKKKGFQNAVYLHLLKTSHVERKCAMKEAIRKKLVRMKLDLPIAHATDRAMRRLLALKGKAKPKKFITLFKALLNGWATSRRMRSMNGGNIDICPFCKGPSTEDSIEHFAKCEVCNDVFLQKGLTCDSLKCFLCLDDSCCNTTTLLAKLQCLHSIFVSRKVLVKHCASAPPLSVPLLLRANLI